MRAATVRVAPVPPSRYSMSRARVDARPSPAPSAGRLPRPSAVPGTASTAFARVKPSDASSALMLYLDGSWPAAAGDRSQFSRRPLIASSSALSALLGVFTVSVLCFQNNNELENIRPLIPHLDSTAAVLKG